MRVRLVKARRNENGSPTPREIASASEKPDIVQLPKRRCLAIDGGGSPGGEGFKKAVPPSTGPPTR